MKSSRYIFFVFLLALGLASGPISCGGGENDGLGYDLDGDGSPGRGSGGSSDDEDDGLNPAESPPPDDDDSGETTLGCRARGFNFTCWHSGCYQVGEGPAAVSAMKGMGANWVEIVPTWYQETVNSNEIFEDPERSPTAEDLVSAVFVARQQGLQVALKPHVDLADGGWRGEIAPQDLAAWQESYRNFILTFASRAQGLGIEILSIGTELKTRSSDAAFWRGLIPEIRGRYTGFLTYSANWDEYWSVPFWDLVDFIGIDFYFPLTQETDPTREALEEALGPIRTTLESFSVEKGRPFLITEVGYRSLDGMNRRPYDYAMGGEVDLQEQADAYGALLTVFGDDRSWLEGIFWWNLEPDLEGGLDDDSYSPYGKPAAEVLRNYWGGVTCTEES